MSDDIPPPPPGFTRRRSNGPDAPPPPPGFARDAVVSAASRGEGPEREQGTALGALWGGLVHGGGNILTGARQLASRIPGMPEATGETPQGADLAAQRRQRSYLADPVTRSHPVASAIGEVGGEMGATLPLGLIRGATLGRGLLAGAAGGAAGGALSPVTSGGDYWHEKAMQAGLGAALGGGMGAAGAAMSPASIAGPRPFAGGRPSPLVTTAPGRSLSEQDAARAMTERGVRLTPGMATPGGSVQEAERVMQSFPIIRGFVRGQVGRSLDDFNRAGMRQALEPIGGMVPRNIQAGHPLMEYGEQEFAKAYNQVLPHITVDKQGVERAIQNNAGLQQLIGEMAPEDAARFQKMIDSRILNRFGPTGVIDGPTFKKLESDASARANSLAGTTTGDEIGGALHDALGIVRKEVENQNPQFAPALQRINQGYAMFKRLQFAGNRRAGAEGKFTPSDLLVTIKNESTDPEFSRGQALLQTLGEAGNKVMSGSFVNQRDSMRWAEMIKGAIAGIPYGAIAAAQKAPVVGAAVGRGGPAAGAAVAGTGQTPPEAAMPVASPPPRQMPRRRAEDGDTIEPPPLRPSVGGP